MEGGIEKKKGRHQLDGGLLSLLFHGKVGRFVNGKLESARQQVHWK